MAEIQKAKIFASIEKCMKGEELKRLRKNAGLHKDELAEKMAEFGWYREKVYRLEKSEHFCLHPEEMQKLLEVLRAGSV